MNTSEIRTYLGESGTTASDCFRGLRIGERYTGVVQENGRVIVSIVGSKPGRGGVLLRIGESGLKNKLCQPN